MEERLQKIISRAGLASRRTAEELILAGRVKVNGAAAMLGMKADEARDEILIDGKPLGDRGIRLYLLLHKPPGYVTTLKDPQGRPVVTDLLQEIPQRIYPIGRLDYNSEGLLLLTNDGDFAQKIGHPRNRMPKTYRVKVQGNPEKKHLEALRSGIRLEDGIFRPLEVNQEKRNPKSTWISLAIVEGRNRVIRRALESLGFRVARLIRTSIGPIDLADLPPGRWRHLTREERQALLNQG